MSTPEPFERDEIADDLCVCGHPRRVHDYLDADWPAICSHADPQSTDPERDPMEGVCMCFKFEAES